MVEKQKFSALCLRIPVWLSLRRQDGRQDTGCTFLSASRLVLLRQRFTDNLLLWRTRYTS